MSSHEFYMARALRLAERGLFTTDPNPRVGCIIVKNGDVVGEGWHQWAGKDHAEVKALHMARTKSRGADCYVTLEPCSHFGRTSPCVDALINSGVKHVFVAMVDPNPLVSGQGINKLTASGMTVTVGLLEQEAESLNPGFCQRMQLDRPYVRSKIAMSLDGRTAMASGESQWISGLAARQNVQQLRARSSAIVTGIGTILADDPALTVRPEGDWYFDNEFVRQPLRVVIDSQLKMPKNAKILNNGKVLIATTVDSTRHLSADIVCLPAQNNQVNLSALMAELARREVNEVMVEAGSVLNGSLLQAQLIDELVFYVAPKIMGDNTKGAFHLPKLHTMDQNIHLQITDIRAVGQDWCITAKPEYKEV